jgi:PII-like signaling protein
VNGTYLRFYMHENVRHRHRLLYEWLLEHARANGIHGGSAFRAIAGFGRHGILHEQHFFELAGDLTIKVEFVMTDEEADKLLESLRRESVSLVYARLPAEFGVIGTVPDTARKPARP